MTRSFRERDVEALFNDIDHGTPKGLARSLAGHTIHTAQSKSWDTLSNGALLDAAEQPASSCYSRPIDGSATSRTCKVAG